MMPKIEVKVRECKTDKGTPAVFKTAGSPAKAKELEMQNTIQSTIPRLPSVIGVYLGAWTLSRLSSPWSILQSAMQLEDRLPEEMG